MGIDFGQLVQGAGALGVCGILVILFFWWLLHRLIPTMQEQLKETVDAFREELKAERLAHLEEMRGFREAMQAERVLDRQSRHDIAERSASGLAELQRLILEQKK